MNTPERTTAAAYPQYLGGQVLADSAALHWPGLYARHFRFPRVVDCFLVPATAEPLISCGLAGTAEFREREPGGPWTIHTIGPGDFFVTRSKTPYEVRFSSPPGQELETISIHLAVEPFRAALEAIFPGKADEIDLIDYFGRDEEFMRLCLLCVGMLSAATPGPSRRVADLTSLLASFLAEKYTAVAPEKPDFRGGLPFRQLRKVEDHLQVRLTKSASLEYAARGIRINAVCPGTIETPMVAEMLAKQPEAMKEILRDQSIGRLGQPEEVASAVLWLYSPGASFVIGHALAVDGGYTVH